MEDSVLYPYKKDSISQLLEFESLLKFNEDLLEGFICPIEEELIVLTIIGVSSSEAYSIANKIIERNLKNCDELIGYKGFNKDNSGIYTYTKLLNFKSLQKNSRVIVFSIQGIDKKVFTPKIMGMLHAISSVLVFVTNKPNLSDIEFISNYKSVFTGANYQDELIRNLSPKFVFCYCNKENIKESYSEEELYQQVEKEDIISESFNKYYRERLVVVCDNKVKDSENKGLEKLYNSIFVEALSKSYRGKKLNGMTLKNIFVEFTNCINRGIGFNINKM